MVASTMMVAPAMPTSVVAMVPVATLVTSVVTAMGAMRIFSWNMDAHKHIPVS